MNGDSLLQNLNDCGCCEGLTVHTPVEIDNRPGLTAIAYRVGTHVKFKQSMLARLSTYPGLAGLKTQVDDDFSITLLDAWATVADVLTFYQERIANESYLRTATERRSILEMARLIGYELLPGVAASSYLAFTLEDAEGAPRHTVIDIGTKVQSVPGPDEKPQTFETIEKIEARVEWNALKAQITRTQQIKLGTTRLYINGTNTQLQPGDAILIVGDDRVDDPTSERWDFRILQTVTADSEKNHTLVTWEIGLGDPPFTKPAEKHIRVFAFRQRASLFGHNAPDFRSLPDETRFEAATNAKKEWKNFEIQTVSECIIDLDRVYPKILKNSWLVLAKSSEIELYEAENVSTVGCSDFALVGTVTRVKLDTNEHLGEFGLRETVVFAQSEELQLSNEPLAVPVYGTEIVLSQIMSDLKPDQAMAVSGKSARVKIADTAESLQLMSADDSKRISLQPGDSLRIMSPPILSSTGTLLTPDELSEKLTSLSPKQLRWHLMDRDSFIGFLTADSDEIILQSAAKDDPIVSEMVFISNAPDAVTADRDRTTIKLRESLQNVYDRETVALNANIARATHGETVQEVVGGGDASQPFQRFTLQQSPLTYISASTPSGTESTLRVRVNDVLWQEMNSLYGQGPRDRVYMTKTDDEGKTTVQFGDGITGTRLPTGQNNIHVTYRKGIGTEGNVKAEQLTTLLTRPLGVKGATNPLVASGGDDRELLLDARRNAPLTVLTIERAVSLQDYEDFSRAFAGVAKALATWIWDGTRNSVFVTVAGPKGAAIEKNSETLGDLLTALRKAGDPYVRISIKSYKKAFFKIAGNIKVNPDYQSEKVLELVKQELRSRFSFDARDFGQLVMLSEVIAIIQAVQGVVMVELDKLHRVGESPILNHRLTVGMPEIGENGEKIAAELLMLDHAPIELEAAS